MRLAARTRGVDSGDPGIVAGVRPAFAVLRRRIFCPGQKMVEAAGIEISRHVKKISPSCVMGNKYVVNVCVRSCSHFSASDGHHAPSRTKLPIICPVLSRPKQEAGGVTGGRWWTQIDGFIRVKKFIQTHFVCFQCPAPSIGRFVKVTETDIPKYNDTAPRPIAPQLAAKKNS